MQEVETWKEKPIDEVQGLGEWEVKNGLANDDDSD